MEKETHIVLEVNSGMFLNFNEILVREYPDAGKFTEDTAEQLAKKWNKISEHTESPNKFKAISIDDYTRQ